ncbi:MAG: response regulator [Pseudomonadota bacterium]
MMNERTILLVDDEENIIRSLSRLLRREGYRILTARNALEGLGRLRNDKVDLVIADYKMPGMDGVEFLKAVKTKYPEIARIILTGYEDSRIAISAINEGEVYRFVTKPWNGDELKITIKQALEHHDLLHEARILLKKARKQSSLLTELEREYPGITKRPESLEDAYFVPEEDLSISPEELMERYFPEEKGSGK